MEDTILDNPAPASSLGGTVKKVNSCTATSPGSLLLVTSISTLTVSVVCIEAVASPLPHYVDKLWANGPPGEPKGRTDAVKVEMEVTSSKDPGDIAVQELTFFTVPPKLLDRAKLVSLHIQIVKLAS